MVILGAFRTPFLGTAGQIRGFVTISSCFLIHALISETPSGFKDGLYSIGVSAAIIPKAFLSLCCVNHTREWVRRTSINYNVPFPPIRLHKRQHWLRLYKLLREPQGRTKFTCALPGLANEHTSSMAQKALEKTNVIIRSFLLCCAGLSESLKRIYNYNACFQSHVLSFCSGLKQRLRACIGRNAKENNGPNLYMRLL